MLLKKIKNFLDMYWFSKNLLGEEFIGVSESGDFYQLVNGNAIRIEKSDVIQYFGSIDKFNDEYAKLFPEQIKAAIESTTTESLIESKNKKRTNGAV